MVLLHKNKFSTVIIEKELRASSYDFNPVHAFTTTGFKTSVKRFLLLLKKQLQNEQIRQ